MITKQLFGTTRSGDSVTRYTLTNANGMTVQVLDYGCIIQSVIVPDRNGKPVDVVTRGRKGDRGPATCGGL